MDPHLLGQEAAQDQGKSKSYSPELDTEAQLSKQPDTPLPRTQSKTRQPEPSTWALPGFTSSLSKPINLRLVNSGKLGGKRRGEC